MQKTIILGMLLACGGAQAQSPTTSEPLNGRWLRAGIQQYVITQAAIQRMQVAMAKLLAKEGYRGTSV
jgi:hypothetical protein